MEWPKNKIEQVVKLVNLLAMFQVNLKTNKLDAVSKLQCSSSNSSTKDTTISRLNKIWDMVNELTLEVVVNNQLKRLQLRFLILPEVALKLHLLEH